MVNLMEEILIQRKIQQIIDDTLLGVHTLSKSNEEIKENKWLYLYSIDL
jgi:hypothetical protein